MRTLTIKVSGSIPFGDGGRSDVVSRARFADCITGVRLYRGFPFVLGSIEQIQDLALSSPSSDL